METKSLEENNNYLNLSEIITIIKKTWKQFLFIFFGIVVCGFAFSNYLSERKVINLKIIVDKTLFKYELDTVSLVFSSLIEEISKMDPERKQVSTYKTQIFSDLQNSAWFENQLFFRLESKMYVRKLLVDHFDKINISVPKSDKDNMITDFVNNMSISKTYEVSNTSKEIQEYVLSINTNDVDNYKKISNYILTETIKNIQSKAFNKFNYIKDALIFESQKSLNLAEFAKNNIILQNKKSINRRITRLKEEIDATSKKINIFKKNYIKQLNDKLRFLKKQKNIAQKLNIIQPYKNILSLEEGIKDVYFLKGTSVIDSEVDYLIETINEENNKDVISNFQDDNRYKDNEKYIKLLNAKIEAASALRYLQSTDDVLDSDDQRLLKNYDIMIERGKYIKTIEKRFNTTSFNFINSLSNLFIYDISSSNISREYNHNHIILIFIIFGLILSTIFSFFTYTFFKSKNL